MITRSLTSGCRGDSTEPMLHQEPYHPVQSLCVINEMRDKGQLCDVSLRVGNSATTAHRLVLASSSAYFYAMFNGDGVDQSRSEIELNDLGSDALRTLVEFTYTGRVLITVENVENLLSASSLLQIDSVRDACCTFLVTNLRPDNCLRAWRFAAEHSYDELSTRSRLYALHNFEAVARGEEFLQLSFSEVDNLVSADESYEASGQHVYVGVVRWIKRELTERSLYTARLLARMRLDQMSKEFLLDVVFTEPLVRNDLECNNLLLSALKHQLFSAGSSDVSSTLIERPISATVPYVFAIGGAPYAINAQSKSGERYDPFKDRWLPIKNMLRQRSEMGVATLGKLIYAVGGYYRTQMLSSVECYDPLNNKWSKVPPMGSKRANMGISAMDGLLYVCGGSEWTSGENTVERYHPSTGVWTSCPRMTTEFQCNSLSVVDNCLYAIGDRELERYDPRMSMWITVTKLQTMMLGFAVAALDNMLYCVGGTRHSKYIYRSNGDETTGERFNVRRNAWEPIAKMRVGRDRHSMVAIEGGLLAIGGNTMIYPVKGLAGYRESLNSTERYDPLTDQWTMSTPMQTPRHSFGAVVLYGNDDLVAKLSTAVQKKK